MGNGISGWLVGKGSQEYEAEASAAHGFILKTLSDGDLVAIQNLLLDTDLRSQMTTEQLALIENELDGFAARRDGRN